MHKGSSYRKSSVSSIRVIFLFFVDGIIIRLPIWCLNPFSVPILGVAPIPQPCNNNQNISESEINEALSVLLSP